MPYTLKPSKVFVKDPNSTGYLPQNVITEESTQEQLSQIQSAGTTQVNAINTQGNAKVAAIETKGEEVLESIPDDYSALSGEVSDLKSASPTDETGESLLAAETMETELLDIVLRAEAQKIANVEELSRMLENAPLDDTGLNLLEKEEETTSKLELIKMGLSKVASEETAQSVLKSLSDENTMLGVLKSVIVEYIKQQNDDKGEEIKIPDYFAGNLSNVISLYRGNSESVGNGGDSFVFITDTHWGVNAKHSPALIQYLIENTNLRNVFCGGDILDSGSKASELAKGYDFMRQFAFVPGGLKTVIGNHDYNKHGHVDDSSYWFTLAETYALFCPKAEMEMQDVQCIEPSTGYYEISYYVDVPATNTRYLFVSIPFGSVYPATRDWVIAQLTNNPTKNFVLFSHFLYKNSEGEMAGGANGLMSAIKSFSNLKAWIFGHIHVDRVYYTTTGIPVVGTDTDSSRLTEDNPYAYTLGTITEQAFDIMTVDYALKNVYCARVGRGKHRLVNGGVNELSVAGTLILTSKITPTAWESSNTTVATINGGTVTGVASGSAIIKASSPTTEEYWYIKVN